MTDSDNKNSEDEKEKFWPQWLAGLILSLNVLNSGLTNGWSSPYLAQLTSPESDSPLKLTELDTPWIASLLNLGRLFGASLGAFLQMYISRKTTLIFGGIPMAIGWICIINAISVPWLYAARFCLGTGSGAMWTSLTLYLGEIAHPSIRGALIFMNMNLNNIGNVLGNAMGAYLPMEIFAYIGLIPNVLFLALFSLIPDSPYHYIQNGELEKAEESLRWFRRKTDVKKEIQDIQHYSSDSKMNLYQRLKEFRLPGNRKSTLIIILLQLFSVFSLFNIFYSYQEIIIRKSEVKNITPSTVVTFLGLSSITTNFVAAYLVEKIGRKNLLMASGIGVTISLTLLGLHFHLMSLRLNIDRLWLLSVFALFLHSLSFNYGLGSVPSTLTGELFPPNIKSVAGFGSTASASLFSFLTTQAFQPLTNLIGEKYVFGLCAIVVFSSVPFVFYYLPETKGKSLLEIQHAITGKNENRKTNGNYV